MLLFMHIIANYCNCVCANKIFVFVFVYEYLLIIPHKAFSPLSGNFRICFFSPFKSHSSRKIYTKIDFL